MFYHGRVRVEYREEPCTIALNHVKGMPFDWSLNPYMGCVHQCTFCYVRAFERRADRPSDHRYGTSIRVKVNVAERLRAELARASWKGGHIVIGAATDPYQPGEGDYGVTRRFLELVAQQRGLRLSITTKGALILRDLELLERIQQRSSLQVHVSLISPHAELLRKIEPLAPPPEVRLHVMRRLVEAGVDVSLTVAPVLPALTDREADLELLFERARAAGVQSASRLLFLRSPTREKYFRWLAADFPRYLEAYQNAYASRVYLRGGYARRIQALFERLRERHGMRKGWSDEARPVRPRAPEQLSLWARGGTS